MTRVVKRPSVGASMLGGSIRLPPQPCTHGPARRVSPWTGEEGTAGTVAVVGAGKMGLPLAAQFATHGWSVIAVDVNPAVVDAINAGQSHVGEEPGLAEMVAEVHAAGRLRATLDAAEASRDADVVVLIVPVMLDEQHQPDYRYMDPAVDSIAPGVHAGLTIIFETTLPIGDTRKRFAPRLERASGLVAGRDFHVAFSPERLFSGAVLANLAAYPKLVGGTAPASTDRAAAFYASVLDAEVVAMSSSEAAEFSKLADTTYRDVNIGLANEFARVADLHGIDVTEVIAAANSQPYSHIHMPGIGVGGHCIPVYPHLLLARAPLTFGYNLIARVLPPFTEMAARGERRELRAWARGMGIASAFLAVIGAGLGALLGPILVSFAFGNDFKPPADLAALAAAGVVLAGGGLFIGQILVARGQPLRLAVAWIFALIACVWVFHTRCVPAGLI